MRKNTYRVDDKNLNEKDFKNYVFSTGKLVSVKDPMFLKCALELGEYVIGTRYNPFTLQNVYHYENNSFQVFNFKPGCHVEPLNIKQTYKCDNISLNEAVSMIYTFGCHDDFLVNPAKDMLDLNSIKNS